MSASANFAELDRMSAERKGYLSEINHQKLLVGLILARDVLGEPGRKVGQNLRISALDMDSIS